MKTIYDHKGKWISPWETAPVIRFCCHKLYVYMTNGNIRKRSETTLCIGAIEVDKCPFCGTSISVERINIPVTRECEP